MYDVCGWVGVGRILAEDMRETVTNCYKLLQFSLRISWHIVNEDDIISS